MNEVIQKSSKGWAYWRCPACGFMHGVPVERLRGYAGPVWEFNGDLHKPTLSPSVRHRCEYGPEKREHCCHYFVREGVIEFCGDCTHAMAGKRVPMLPIEEDSASR